MPRSARLDVPNVLQHVMARGIEGREIFRDKKDQEEFLRRLSEEVTKGQGQLFGDLSYSALAKAYQRFSIDLGRGMALRKKVETIRGKLSSFKG